MLGQRLHGIGRPSRRTWIEALALATVVGLAVGAFGAYTRSTAQQPIEGDLGSVPSVTGTPTPRAPGETPARAGQTAAPGSAPKASSSPNRSARAGRPTPEEAAVPAEAEPQSTPVETTEPTSEPTETSSPTATPAETPTPDETGTPTPAADSSRS